MEILKKKNWKLLVILLSNYDIYARRETKLGLDITFSVMLHKAED